MARTRRGAVAALAAAVALAALTGCGTDGRTARGPGPGGGAAGPAAVEPTAGQSRLLERAEQVLIGRCMANRGFRYAVTEPPPAQRSFPYGLDDVEWARAHGYGGRDDRAAEAARLADPNQRYFHGLSARGRAAARTALMGASPVGLTATAPTGTTLTASPDGCIARAERSLYGDLAAWFRVKVVTMNIRPAQEAKVRADPRYAEAVGAWAACMRAAGRPYGSPDDSRAAAAAFARELPPDRADAAESALAVAEATCATGTALSRVSHALDLSYGDEFRARHRGDVDLRRRLQNAALPEAERVVPPSDRPDDAAGGTAPTRASEKAGTTGTTGTTGTPGKPDGTTPSTDSPGGPHA
ncbi:hypothetical protein ACGFXC_03865 [Streptomyces sp. NPDC048507]|uniref:hypothetical protein n=1 Tax=Streptomyces sp. NPDC048507 TaxID=3365560 RepID=UPI003724AD5B